MITAAPLRPRSRHPRFPRALQAPARLDRPRLTARAAAVFVALQALFATTPAAHAAEVSGGGRAPEAQKESDWVDNRWNKTDVGPFLASNLALPGARLAKGLSIQVGDDTQAGAKGAVAYDTATAAWRGAWLGGFLRFDPGRYGLIQAPALQGSLVAQAPAPAHGTLPVRYVGLRVHGPRVVLESTVGGTRVLESPWLVSHDGRPVFTRALAIDAGPHPLRIPIVSTTTLPNAATNSATQGFTGIATVGTNTLAYRISAPGGQVRHENGTLTLELPASTSPRNVWIALSPASTSSSTSSSTFAPAPATAPATATSLASLPAPESPTAFAAPGPARWLPELETRGQRGADLDLLSVDTLTAPYDNPWKALLFFAGIDFAPDGRTAYACTIHGDVWRITGIDDSLRTLRWHRFATGLFQPLGLKVRDGLVHVLGRDQITRLRDVNNDGEADVYENFCNQIRTSTGGHDYVTCLEQDKAGNFYFVDPSGLHRVSPDGARLETIATGWRNPNGMGVSPDGRILTVAPQQGTWTPSSQISQARPGGYYGFGGPRPSPDRPLGYDAPLCWIPHRVDNSSGSQVWVPPGTWGPLGGQMLHLLWGRCGLMLVLRDQIGDVAQGAVVPLPGKLLSGPNRGSFHPRDGQLYIAGSTGWQTAAARDGAIQRVRFNANRPATLPTAWHAHSNGLTLTFSTPLDRAAAEDPGSYAVHQWNYRYAADYGSKDWSVTNPAREGRDEVAVKSARLLPDNRTVFLELPNLSPVMQMELQYSLNTAAGRAVRSQLWLTLNALDSNRR